MAHNSSRRRSGALRAVVIGTALAVFWTSGADTVRAEVPLGETCPALYVLGVQGPEEAPADAATTTDSGALGQFFTTLLARAGDLVQRSYIRYGYSDDGAALAYEQAVTTATDRLSASATEIVERCPATRLAVAGYGQGAAAVSAFADEIGTGSGVVAPDKVAGTVLFANPTRSSASVFPGRPGQTTPSAAPGTAGTEVSRIEFSDTTAAGGSGIAGQAVVDYGELSGRVADLCTSGDLTCDAPADTALTTTVKNIAAQSDLRDPIAAISTIAQALAATVWKTAEGVVTEDLSGTSLDQLSYEPTKTLGQRLTEASDPTTPMPGVGDALSVLFRLGTIGLNTVIAVAEKVFTTSTIAELATVGLANPVAALASLGAKVVDAIVDLIPPQTALGWVDQAFTAITTTVSDEADLYTLATRTEYSSTSGRHGSYTTAAANSSGTPPLTLAADWFAALARDIAHTQPATTVPTTIGMNPTSHSPVPPSSTTPPPTASSADASSSSSATP